MPSAVATAGEQTKGVAVGAGVGALFSVSSMILGPILGPLVAGVGGGMVMKEQADLIALIAGMRLFDGLFGGLSAPAAGPGVM